MTRKVGVVEQMAAGDRFIDSEVVLVSGSHDSTQGSQSVHDEQKFVLAADISVALDQMNESVCGAILRVHLKFIGPSVLAAWCKLLSRQ